MVFDGLSFFRDNNIIYTNESSNVSQGWVGLRCPFCSDSSDHLGFNEQSGAFSCWHCGAHSPLDTIEALLSISRGEAITVYRQYLKEGASHYIARKKATADRIILPGKDFSPVERRYLEKRMFTGDQIEFYDMRSGGIMGLWQYRIVFPIYYNGMVVSATGRSLFDVKPKYYTLPPEKELIRHKDIFFGLDYVPGKAAAIVEGPVDAMRGGPGFIASFGVNLTDEQLTLCSFFDTLYMVRDADDAGENSTEQAYRLAALYGNRISIEVIDINNGHKDLGETPEDQLVELRKEIWGV